MVAVLFVCLGNICRSPAAEAMMQAIAKKDHFNVKVTSCGVSGWNLGASPHPRMQEAASKRGLILSGKSKAFDPDFFDRFDYILVATKEIQDLLLKHGKTAEHRAKIQLMTEYSKFYKGEDVQDPFGGSADAFDETLDMLEECCKELLVHIKPRKKHPEDFEFQKSASLYTGQGSLKN